jgi:endonuclease/exonuclease/phosphatase family metal-dependent hydrolase
MSISILTLNLWNIEGPLELRFSALAKGLKQLRPDIVCLQEASRDPQSARSQSEQIAEYCNLAHCVEKDELSILCRYPVVGSESTSLPEFAGDWPRLVLLVEFLIERRPLLVANTHLAYRPEMVQERKAQTETLLAAIKRYRSAGKMRTKILCGDFNDVPNSPAVRLVLDCDEGFHDAYARCRPNSHGFTYSCQNPFVDPSSTQDQRIDYIFASGDLVPKDCNVVFDGSNGFDFVSDHFGVFCNLAFKRGSQDVT